MAHLRKRRDDLLHAITGCDAGRQVNAGQCFGLNENGAFVEPGHEFGAQIRNAAEGDGEGNQRGGEGPEGAGQHAGDGGAVSGRQPFVPAKGLFFHLAFE